MFKNSFPSRGKAILKHPLSLRLKFPEGVKKKDPRPYSLGSFGEPEFTGLLHPECEPAKTEAPN